MMVTLIYTMVGLLALSIIISRASRRQVDAARKALAADEAVLATAGLSLQEALRALHDAEQRHSGQDGRLEQAQAQVNSAQQALDAAREAPVERYHVADRLEPRPGTLWSVTVTRSADGPGPAPWTGERVILVSATGQSEAMERMALRYPRSAGFEIRSATPCPLFQPEGSPRSRPRRGLA